MTIIPQWKAAQEETIKNLREQAIKRTPTGATVVRGAAFGTVIGTASGLAFAPLTFGVSMVVSSAVGGAVGSSSSAAAVSCSIVDALKQSIAEIDRKILEVNKKLQEFYCFCRETATNQSVTPKQVYAISLECIRESASTTEQITAIIRKYQNPRIVIIIKGFGFFLSSDMLPKNLKEIDSKRSLDIARKLENERDKLMGYLNL